MIDFPPGIGYPCYTTPLIEFSLRAAFQWYQTQWIFIHWKIKLAWESANLSSTLLPLSVQGGTLVVLYHVFLRNSTHTTWLVPLYSPCKWLSSDIYMSWVWWRIEGSRAFINSFQQPDIYTITLLSLRIIMVSPNYTNLLICIDPSANVLGSSEALNPVHRPLPPLHWLFLVEVTFLCPLSRSVLSLWVKPMLSRLWA